MANMHRRGTVNPGGKIAGYRGSPRNLSASLDFSLSLTTPNQSPRFASLLSPTHLSGIDISFWSTFNWSGLQLWHQWH